MEPKNPEENMKPEILAIGLNIPEKKIYCSLVGGGVHHRTQSTVTKNHRNNASCCTARGSTNQA